MIELHHWRRHIHETTFFFWQHLTRMVHLVAVTEVRVMRLRFD
jgi:hypothetical protein